MTDFTAARNTMVDTQLRPAEVTDPHLLRAMREIPRELFLPPGLRLRAYLDAPVPVAVGSRRALPAPTSFARLVQLAGIGAGDRVLDVGCGPGYSTAVLARLARDVVGLEWEPALAAAARTGLLGLSVTNAGIAFGPIDRPPPGPAYDAVVVEGMLDEPPRILLDSLREGGRLAVVLSRAGLGVAHLFVREGGTASGRPVFDLPMPDLLPPDPPEFRF